MSHPHLTVAVVCEDNGQILMVNETDNGINCWNQPAGHVESGESLEQAAIRETLEETGYRIKLSGIQRLYQGLHQESGTHYLRVCFAAEPIEKVSDELDPDIIQACWIDRKALLSGDYVLRSPMTRATLEDHTNVPIYPLSMINRFFPGAE